MTCQLFFVTALDRDRRLHGFLNEMDPATGRALTTRPEISSPVYEVVDEDAANGQMTVETFSGTYECRFPTAARCRHFLRLLTGK